jgi:hypothetical protein
MHNTFINALHFEDNTEYAGKISGSCSTVTTIKIIRTSPEIKKTETFLKFKGEEEQPRRNCIKLLSSL